ncbi:hypothetical protein BHE74_00043994 [Ensete ventricosum]|nr:hypothetical protein BHE74_00043994 [Ensete ventricosum]RZS09516.1 hypothetical protein BHM03_00040601 [Ensete ventricosum]
MERCRWTDLAVAITRQVERDVFSDQSSSALVHRPNRLQIPDSGETPCIRDGHKRVTARHAPEGRRTTTCMLGGGRGGNSSMVLYNCSGCWPLDHG